MRHPRLWILGVALGSFATGMNVGLAVPKVLAAEDESRSIPDDDRDYVRRFVQDYALSASQAHSLKLVMQGWREEEMAALLSAGAAQLPPAIQNKLLQARSRATQRIRVMLTPAQRERYDADSRLDKNR